VQVNKKEHRKIDAHDFHVKIKLSYFIEVHHKYHFVTVLQCKPRDKKIEEPGKIQRYQFGFIASSESDKRKSRLAMTGGLFCVVAVLGLSQGLAGGDVNPRQPALTKRGALSYVVSQGCPYLVQ
jgi:hypothetical protein